MTDVPFLWVPELSPVSATSFSLITTITLNRLNYTAQSQSQSYFTTGGLSPISSSWQQGPLSPAEHLRSYSFSNILSEERTDLTFTIVAGPRQRSHSHARVLRDS
jgi:hypothetical protein